jgi:hypothetical protein
MPPLERREDLSRRDGKVLKEHAVDDADGPRIFPGKPWEIAAPDRRVIFGSQ